MLLSAKTLRFEVLGHETVDSDNSDLNNAFFTVSGGLNAPLIIVCKGPTGRLVLPKHLCLHGAKGSDIVFFRISLDISCGETNVAIVGELRRCDGQGFRDWTEAGDCEPLSLCVLRSALEKAETHNIRPPFRSINEIVCEYWDAMCLCLGTTPSLRRCPGAFEVREIAPDVFHASFANRILAASTMMRIQESYESPCDAVRGAPLHSLPDLKRVYRDLKPERGFTYYTDWPAFNIPGTVIENAIADANTATASSSSRSTGADGNMERTSAPILLPREWALVDAVMKARRRASIERVGDVEDRWEWGAPSSNERGFLHRTPFYLVVTAGTREDEWNDCLAHEVPRLDKIS